MLSPLSSQDVTPAAHCCPREFTTIRRQHRPHEKIEEGSCSPPSTLDPFPQSVERSQPLLRSRAGIPHRRNWIGFQPARPDRAGTAQSGYQKSPHATHQGLPLLREVTTLRERVTVTDLRGLPANSLVRASDTGERPTPVATTGSVTHLRSAEFYRLSLPPHRVGT